MYVSAPLIAFRMPFATSTRPSGAKLAGLLSVMQKFTVLKLAAGTVRML
jgi:hypothetical protein